MLLITEKAKLLLTKIDKSAVFAATSKHLAYFHMHGPDQF